MARLFYPKCPCSTAPGRCPKVFPCPWAPQHFVHCVTVRCVRSSGPLWVLGDSLRSVDATGQCAVYRGNPRVIACQEEVVYALTDLMTINLAADVRYPGEHPGRSHAHSLFPLVDPGGETLAVGGDTGTGRRVPMGVLKHLALYLFIVQRDQLRRTVPPDEQIQGALAPRSRKRQVNGSVRQERSIRRVGTQAGQRPLRRRRCRWPAPR